MNPHLNERFRRQTLATIVLVSTAAILTEPRMAARAPYRQSAARAAAVKTATRIVRADYEGDRAALQRLFQDLAPMVENGALASRVRYWRGFAMWRRALNGFNDSADRGDIERDLQQAVREFDEALARDPGFVDAKLGEVSCLQNLTFLHQSDAAKVGELVARFVPLFKESVAAAPEHPRLLWVQGASQWYAPPGLPASEIEGRQTTALATYERGLQLARKQKTESDPLEPSWGEPELLMNLAWSNLHKTTPDVRAAEAYAKEALALVPYWHYVRDILMKQIRDARGKQ